MYEAMECTRDKAELPRFVGSDGYPRILSSTPYQTLSNAMTINASQSTAERVFATIRTPWCYRVVVPDPKTSKPTPYEASII
jgi:hypothetical protein